MASRRKTVVEKGAEKVAEKTATGRQTPAAHPASRLEATSRKVAASPPPPGQAERMTIRDLEQVRALADPLRLRLLESFCVERTTAQVAQLLDLKPTRLYHHVEALERASLLRKTRMQRKRGTLEPYYLAVARKFVADSSLFATGEGEEQPTQAWEQIVSSLLEGTASELRELLAAGRGVSLEGEGLLAYLQLRTGPRELARVRRSLERLVQSVERSSRDDSADGTAPKSTRARRPEDTRTFRLTLAFFPIDGAGARDT